MNPLSSCRYQYNSVAATIRPWFLASKWSFLAGLDHLIRRKDNGDKMNEDTTKSIRGFIQLWIDLCFIQGNEGAANELKPHVEASLAEPGSPLHEVIQFLPSSYRQVYFGMRRQYPHVRHTKLRALLNQEPVRVFATHLSDSMFLLGKVYQNEGITGAELWRELNRQFEQMLGDIALAELMGTTGDMQDALSGDSDFGTMIRAALSNIGLKPGTIAGKDGSLYNVLSSRVKKPAFEHLEPNERDVKLYELDLKAALWEISKGKAWEVLLESIRAQTNDKNEQIILLIRLINGENPELVRTVFIRALRQAINQLPDIAREVKTLESKYKVVPLCDDEKPRDGGGDEPTSNMASLFQERGVDISKLNTRQLNTLNDLLHRIKYGKTQKQYYSKDEPAGKQREKRLKDKIRELQTKPE